MKALFFFIFWLLIAGDLFAQFEGRVLPGSQTIPSGESVVLRHQGTTSIVSRSRQWQRNFNGGAWMDIPGATGSTFNTGALPNPLLTDIRWGFRVVTDLGITTAIVITVTPEPRHPGGVGPASQTIPSGGSLTLTHQGWQGITFRQWQRSEDGGRTWTNMFKSGWLTHHTGAIFNNSSAPITRRYRVWSNAGYSEETVITINPAPTPGRVTPEAITVPHSGGVHLSHIGEIGLVSRQWQQLSSNGTWVSIPGATGAVLSLVPLTNTGPTNITQRYRVLVNGNLTTNVSTVTITPRPLDPGHIYPESQTIPSGGSVTLTHYGTLDVTWRQWQRSDDDGRTWTYVFKGNRQTHHTGAIFNNSQAPFIRRYRVWTNAGYSEETVIRVNASPNAGSVTPGTPKVIRPGESATLTYLGPPGTTSYQWQMFCVVSNAWVDILGANQSMFNTGALTDSGDHRFRVRLNGGASYSAEKVIRVPHRTAFAYDASGNRIGRRIVTLPATQSEEAYFFASSMMEMPEYNAFFDNFYTDRLDESDVVIFPNPTRGALAVEILNKNPNIPHQITVFNLNGTVVFQQNNIGPFTEIDLSSRPRGVYLLRISSPDSFITWTIIKE